VEATDDVDRIKQALDNPRALCDALGLIPDGGRGRTWFLDGRDAIRVPCPWHGERTGSCSVTLAGGTVRVHCFGCDQSGDALSLIAQVEGLDLRTDFRRVLDVAADLAGVPRPDRSRPDYAPVVRAAPRVYVEPGTPDDGVIDAITEVLAQRARVRDEAGAWRYLVSRGLDTTEAAGWYALPGEARRREALRAAIVAAVGEDAWRASGLATAEGPYAGAWSWAWRGPRLVIPWRAPNGTVESIQGRYLGDCPEGVAKYVFPRGRSPQWPFGCDGVGVAGEETPVAIVEGALDAVSFGELARRHGVDVLPLGIPGTGGWRASWLRLCRKRPCIVALDPDKAGEKLRATLVPELSLVAKRGPRGPEVSVKKPRGGKDWNDVLRGAA
jgi:DNA primase